MGSAGVRGVTDNGSGTGGEAASRSASLEMLALWGSCRVGSTAGGAGLGVLGTEYGAGPGGSAGVKGPAQDDRPRTSEVSSHHAGVGRSMECSHRDWAGGTGAKWESRRDGVYPR